ncbi:hypothetical protein V7S43_005282 [Phytophthora oleae]|uniref:Uncharacterized protein n=1 Tax=Phytophthora oleae TaxID=2107226 RepID=A0ABD3FWC0_9STRA
MIVIMATKLLREQFVVCSVKRVTCKGPAVTVARRLNLFQCIRKVIVPMMPHLLLGAVGAVGGDFYLYSKMPRTWSKFKPILYISAFWGFYSMAIADAYARRIFRMETVRGIVTSSLKDHSKKQSTSEKNPQRFWTPSPCRILHMYRQNAPMMIFALIAIIYVHVLSQFIHFNGRWGMFACACVSIVLKLLLQELAKYIMLSVRRPVSRRVMVALVSTPTILVDTQVRILLLRQGNLSVSVAGTVLLAIFEIAMRSVKSVVVQHQTRRPTTVPPASARQRSSSTNTSLAVIPSLHVKVLPLNAQTSDTTKGDVATQSRAYSRSGEAPAEYKARKDAEERRRKLRVLHAGEIYADMYAEYIAIGCSYAILVFYQDHPQYEFSILFESNSTEEGPSSDQQLMSLGILQLIVEILVDFLACILEASQGVEFKSVNQDDPFLVFFLAMLTFSNVAISAGMYLR